MGVTKQLLSFLAEEEKLSERRLVMLNLFLDTTTTSFPPHIIDTLNLLRQNTEEDLSNILHVQSIFPSGLSTNTSKPKQSPVKAVKAAFSDSRPVLGQVEECVEAAVAVTDDLFLMEGVDTNDQEMSPQSTFSDEEREDSELDEGIHIPTKLRNKKTCEVAGSLPVGIPWPRRCTALWCRPRRWTGGRWSIWTDPGILLPPFRPWPGVSTLVLYLVTTHLETCPGPG